MKDEEAKLESAIKESRKQNREKKAKRTLRRITDCVTLKNREVKRA